MSLKPIDGQRSFDHSSYLCGELFGPANRYRLFREKIFPKLVELRDKLESLPYSCIKMVGEGLGEADE